MKKLFRGINLTWPKVIIGAVIAGVVTAVFAIVLIFLNTSFHTITATFEVWILFGIFIIMNSKSNLDSALKCFVFFLISQPLVYLIQVPFSSMGWGLFGYYWYWFIWTLLCFPMGFVGYYMKKDKWWGYLILLPMILMTGMSYMNYFSDCQFSFPRYILITLFCAAAMILYPVCIFRDKRIRITGAAIGAAAVVTLTVICLLNPPVYSTDILSSSEETPLDDTYTVAIEDSSYGDIKIVYMEEIEDYMVHADLKKSGETSFTLKAPDGKTREFGLTIERDTYEVTEK